MGAYLKKEQIGTLFVRVGALEGGFRGVQPSFKDYFPPSCYKLNKMFSSPLGHVTCATRTYLLPL